MKLRVWTFFLLSMVCVLNTKVAQAAPDITANYVVLMDAETGLVIYERNAHERRYPASTTKLMTGILLLEYVGEALDQPIPISHQSIFSVPAGGSWIGMNEGEHITASEALHAMMMASDNRLSNAIAEFVAGTIEDFAVMMTERARSLGAYNTNFMNPHGLHHPNHYSTAYDLALIQREALNFPYLLEVMGTRIFTIDPTEQQAEVRIFHNTHRMIDELRFPTYYYAPVVGGKTGFTTQARHTLTTYANYEDFGMIAVVLDTVPQGTFHDTRALFAYGQERYRWLEVLSKEITGELAVVQVQGGEPVEIGGVNFSAQGILGLYLPDLVDPEAIEVVVDVPEDVRESVYIGKVVGEVRAYYQAQDQKVLLGVLPVISETYFEYPTVYDMPYVYVAAYEGYTNLMDTALMHVQQVTDLEPAYVNFAGGVLVGGAGYYVIQRVRRGRSRRRYVSSASRARLRGHDRYAYGRRHVKQPPKY